MSDTSQPSQTDKHSKLKQVIADLCSGYGHTGAVDPMLMGELWKLSTVLDQCTPSAERRTVVCVSDDQLQQTYDAVCAVEGHIAGLRAIAEAAGFTPSHALRSDAVPARVIELLRATVDLASEWDEHGAVGPKEPYTWETVARMAMDYARAALAVVPSATERTNADTYRVAADLIEAHCLNLRDPGAMAVRLRAMANEADSVNDLMRRAESTVTRGEPK